MPGSSCRSGRRRDSSRLYRLSNADHSPLTSPAGDRSVIGDIHRAAGAVRLGTVAGEGAAGSSLLDVRFPRFDHHHHSRTRLSCDGHGASPWRTIGIALASAAVSFYVVGAFMPRLFGEREITVGDRGSGPSGGFTQSVGAQFKKPELDSALASADRLDGAHALDQFTCGDDAPTFRFELTLRPQGEVNERYVGVSYAPEVDAPEDRCLSFGSRT